MLLEAVNDHSKTVIHVARRVFGHLGRGWGRVNRYLIVYQSWRNWTQRTAGGDTVDRRFKSN